MCLKNASKKFDAFSITKKCRLAYCGKPSFEVTFRWTVTSGAERRKIEWLAEPQFHH